MNNIEQKLSIYGNGCEICITEEAPLSDGASFFTFLFDGDEKSKAVVFDEDNIFVLNDWQGSYPETKEEIEDYDWIHIGTQQPAFVIDGLPRLF